MLGYALAVVGFGVAIFLLWAALSKRKSRNEKLATFTCVHCGEHHCDCQKNGDTMAEHDKRT